MVRRPSRHGRAATRSCSSTGRCRAWTASRPRRRIRALADLTRRPRLVMVTAYGREEVLKQAEEHGFEDVLIKPVTSVDAVRHGHARLSAPTASEPRPAQSRSARSTHRAPARRARPAGRRQRDQPGGRAGAARRRGLFVDVAENGEVALRDGPRRTTTTSVLMDMQMPVMDGIAATRAIRVRPALPSACRSSP